MAWPPADSGSTRPFGGLMASRRLSICPPRSAHTSREPGPGFFFVVPPQPPGGRGMLWCMSPGNDLGGVHEPVIFTHAPTDFGHRRGGLVLTMTLIILIRMWYEAHRKPLFLARPSEAGWPGFNRLLRLPVAGIVTPPPCCRAQTHRPAPHEGRLARIYRLLDRPLGRGSAAFAHCINR